MSEGAKTAELELQRTMQLFDVSLEVNSTIQKQDLLIKIMETSSRIMNAEASSVILVDEEKGELFLTLRWVKRAMKSAKFASKSVKASPGWVAQTGQSVKIDDAAQDERWSSKVAKRVDYPTRSMLCVPLASKGKIIGVLQVLNKRDDVHFTDRDLQLLESIASPIAASLENAMLYDVLEKTTAAKERMESELRIATDIQMGFLPRQGLYMTRSSGSDLAESNETTVEARAFIRPARQVGGDFYDYFRLGDDKLFCIRGRIG